MIFILLKPQLLRESLHIRRLLTLSNHMQYNQISVYSVNGKANFYSDRKNLILLNTCLALLIPNSLVLFLFLICENLVDKSQKNN